MDGKDAMDELAAAERWPSWRERLGWALKAPFDGFRWRHWMRSLGVWLLVKFTKDEHNVSFARSELALINSDNDPDTDDIAGKYANSVVDAVMELTALFAHQMHSGMSANMVRGYFNMLARWKPLSPITEADGWGEPFNSDGTMQSRRCSGLFKEKDGKVKYYDYYVFLERHVDEETGEEYHTTATSTHSVKYVDLPFTVPDKPVYLTMPDLPDDVSDEDYFAAQARLVREHEEKEAA